MIAGEGRYIPGLLDFNEKSLTVIWSMYKVVVTSANLKLGQQG